MYSCPCYLKYVIFPVFTFMMESGQAIRNSTETLKYSKLRQWSLSNILQWLCVINSIYIRYSMIYPLISSCIIIWASFIQYMNQWGGSIYIFAENIYFFKYVLCLTVHSSCFQSYLRYANIQIFSVQLAPLLKTETSWTKFHGSRNIHIYLYLFIYLFYLRAIGILWQTKATRYFYFKWQ